MLFKGKKNILDDDSAHEIVQNVTDLQTDADSVDLEANAADKMTPEAFAVKELAMSPMQTIDSEFEIPELVDQKSHKVSSDLFSSRRRTLPWQKKNKASSTPSLSLPSMNEDDEESVVPTFTSKFIANSSIVDNYCFNSDESDGTDDDEHLCAICLSCYSKSIIKFVSLWPIIF
jgi:hypothetical protein